jgi:hypothetical protein
LFHKHVLFIKQWKLWQAWLCFVHILRRQSKIWLIASSQATLRCTQVILDQFGSNHSHKWRCWRLLSYFKNLNVSSNMQFLILYLYYYTKTMLVGGVFSTELQRDSCRALTNWATERQLSSSNQLSYIETVVEL